MSWSKPPRQRSAAPDFVHQDPWSMLRAYTNARIALGRAGVSMTTAEQLKFQLAHAQARDAVHLPLDKARLFEDLRSLCLEVLDLRSRVEDREMYLLRPDLGRRLDDASRALLKEREGSERPDLALVVSDGLSTAAVQRNVKPFLEAFLPLAAQRGLCLSPVCFVAMGRVAVADEVGFLLGARATVILIGERPGLSSPDSMGAYMTYGPEVGLTDERRNCISNIRPEGQPYADAARTLDYLVTQALAKGISGVELKDDQALPAEGQVELGE